MKKKKQIRQDLLIIVILTLITVLTWIAFDVYRILQDVEPPQVVKKELESLNAEIEFGVFDYLEQKR